jgi:Predicted phosphoglycerate mutase, AP superfamily
VLRGEGLSDKVSDADPKVEGNKPKQVKALDDNLNGKDCRHPKQTGGKDL